jgi:hypothetical protein
VRFTVRCRVLVPQDGADRAVNGCYLPVSPVGDSPRCPMPDKRSRFFAFLALSLTKVRSLRLVSQANPPDPAALSRKCGEKTPVLRPRRKPPGAPLLWPHLAGITRLAKPAFLP